MSAAVSYDPRTGRPHEEVADTTPHAVAQASPATRAGWLRVIADSLEEPATARALVELADRETALGGPRLTGELARAAAQLRFYATVAEEGSWLGAAIDHLDGGVLARARQPLGPVAVFGA